SHSARQRRWWPRPRRSTWLRRLGCDWRVARAFQDPTGRRGKRRKYSRRAAEHLGFARSHLAADSGESIFGCWGTTRYQPGRTGLAIHDGPDVRVRISRAVEAIATEAWEGS